MTSDAISLRSGEIHLFYCLVDAIIDPLLKQRYRAMLNGEEIAKTDRYVFERGRCTCLTTRALIRYVLLLCTGTSPEAFQFTVNQYGKPDLMPGIVPDPIRFMPEPDYPAAIAVQCGAEERLSLNIHTDAFRSLQSIR